MRKTLLVQVDGIRQVDGIDISILCNALYVGLQSLPLVAMMFTFLDHCERVFDDNQQTPLKDPLHVPAEPIIKARSKKNKEALNGLI